MGRALSSRGLDLLKGEEGCRLTAYWDVDGWSIGWGHHGSDVHPGLCWTQEEADWTLMLDSGFAVDAVNTMVKVPLSQPMFDALVDFVYNEGVGHFETSMLLRKLNQGDYVGASAEFPKWDLAGGQLNDDLRRRRMAEKAMFDGGLDAIPVG